MGENRVTVRGGDMVVGKKTKMEKLQGRYIKMKLGVARNTPDYIWKLEAGRRSIELETRRRAEDYIIQVLRIKEGRWPQICLREEVRRMLNTNLLKWGAEFMKAMREVRDGRI